MQIPFVICSAVKDHIKLPFVIKGLVDNFNQLLEIVVVTPEPVSSAILTDITYKNVRFVLDSELPIDKSRIKARSGWIFQQLVKLLAGYYLFKGIRIWGVIDSDTILKTDVLNDNAPYQRVFFHTRPQNHQPYFDFQNKWLRTTLTPHEPSFIAEIMFFKQCFIEALIRTPEDFLEFCYQNINDRCYLSEYELYGNFVHSLQNANYYYEHKTIINKHFDKINQDWSMEEIQSLVNSTTDCDTITINSIRW